MAGTQELQGSGTVGNLKKNINAPDLPVLHKILVFQSPEPNLECFKPSEWLQFNLLLFGSVLINTCK